MVSLYNKSENIIVSVLRWIAVLPAAVIGSVIISLLICLCMLLGDVFSCDIFIYIRHPEIFSIDHFFTSFILSLALGYSFVSIGTSVSPNNKRVVAFVLFGLLTMVFGTIVIISIINFTTFWRMTINSLCVIVASGVAAFTADS